MNKSQFRLFTTLRFAPLFITQFLGAFHDNLFKNALVVMLLYTNIFNSSIDTKLMTTIAAGVFILPFALFSPIGGYLADKFPKNKVIVNIKIAEIIIAIFGICAITFGSVVLSYIVLFALGTQSALFGPSKYSIVPDHLSKEEMIGGNALLNIGTFSAILLGTIIGTEFATDNGGVFIISAIILLSSISGYYASRFIPANEPASPDVKISFNFIFDIFKNIRFAFSHGRVISIALISVAWFYFMASMFVAQLPNFVKETLNADESVLTFLLIIFSLGVGFGGLPNNTLLKSKINATFVPVASLLISAFAIDLYFASVGLFTGFEESLTEIDEFISNPYNFRIIFDVAMLSIAGGLFVVPLNTMIQHFSEKKHRSRIIAGGAVLNALFMVVSAVISAVVLGVGKNVEFLFLLFGISNLFVALFLLWSVRSRLL